MNVVSKALAVSVAAILTGSGLAGAQSIELGETLYQQNCASCHGAEALGDGPVSVYIQPRPSNLRQLAAANDGVYPFGMVWESIASGSLSAHGTSMMPVWGDVFMAEALPRQVHPGLSADALVEARMLAITYYLQTLQE